MRPEITGVLEVCLYVDDVERSVRFYEHLFGFSRVANLQDRGYAMHAAPRQLLLLFQKGASLKFDVPHDGEGQLHLAFAIPTSQLAGWRSWLEQNAIPVELEKTWNQGGRSLYFRDPDHHLIELATPGTWSVY